MANARSSVPSTGTQAQPQPEKLGLIAFLLHALLSMITAVVGTALNRTVGNRQAGRQRDYETVCLPGILPRVLLPLSRVALGAPQPKMTLVLDLDETLVHSTFRHAAGKTYDLTIEVALESQQCRFYVLKRPHLDLFLQKAAEWFDVVIFTASLPNYADPLIDLLDPHRLVSRRFFRASCVMKEGNFVKELSTVETDMARVVIVDNSPIAYALNRENAVPIESWFENPADEELLNLLPLLAALRHVDDVRSILSMRTH